MKIIWLFFCAFLVTTLLIAGEPFQSPPILAKTSYVSQNPVYKMAGLEQRSYAVVFWVVISRDITSSQKKLNQIITDIYSRNETKCQLSTTPWLIHFYDSVGGTSATPIFSINSYVGMYDSRENKTTLLRKGWESGPRFKKSGVSNK